MNISIEPSLICMSFAIALVGLPIFIAACRRHGGLNAWIALGLGAIGGVALAAIAALWDSVQYSRSTDELWRMVKMSQGHVIQDRGLWIPLGALAGMVVGWLSLATLSFAKGRTGSRVK